MLKRVIRRLVTEGDWANYSRNAMSPESDDREAIEHMSLKTIDGEEELGAHLQDDQHVETAEETWGPVPPQKDRVVFHAETDPFHNMWSILPRP